MTEAAGGAIQWVAELATGAGGVGAEPCASRGEASTVGEAGGGGVSAQIVVLQRKTDKQLWGLAWFKDGFERKGERIVEKTMKGSVAECWNRQQEQVGHPERCIQPLDRLVSVNGKTGREEIKAELASQEVVLEFHRAVPHKEMSSSPAAAPPSRNPSGELRSASPASPRRDNRRASFQDAFSAYLQAVGPPEESVDQGIGVPCAKLAQQSMDVQGLPFDSTNSSSRPLLSTHEVAPSPARVLKPGEHADRHARGWPVAAGLDSFLAQGSRTAEVHQVQEVGSLADTSMRTKVVEMEKQPSGAASSARAASGTPLEPSTQKLSTVVMGPIIDPLSTAKPLVVVARALDPAAEKRDIAERLRIRHGGTRVLLQETSQCLDRQRSCSMDSDDEGSLMRLSHALSSLERTAATKLTDYAGDAVAQEGYHSLQQRLEPGPEEPFRPASVARLSTSSASASVSQQDLQLRASRPTATVDPALACGRRGDSATSPPAPDQPVPPGPTPRQRNVYTLNVQVSEERVCHIQFVNGDNLLQLVKDFLTQNHMREIFEGPLLRRAELMRLSGIQEESVDIVDLLD